MSPRPSNPFPIPQIPPLRQGGLNDYLDDLEKSDPSERKVEKWFYTEWLQRRARVQRLALANAAKRAAAAKAPATAASAVAATGASASSGATKLVEGVTQQDIDEAEAAEEEAEAARELAKAREREIERAIPLPSFFSLDNPIVIAISLALLGASFGGLGR